MRQVKAFLTADRVFIFGARSRARARHAIAMRATRKFYAAQAATTAQSV